MKKNLINALKKLVTSFGGEAKSNNAVDLVDEFADVAAQGGSGGSNVMLVGLTMDSNGGSFDKTWKEIHDALVSGTPVYVKYTAQNDVNVSEDIVAVWPVLYTYAASGDHYVTLAYDNTVPPMVPQSWTASGENNYPAIVFEEGTAPGR